MRAPATGHIHAFVQAAVPPTADFYDAGRKVVLSERLASRRPWVKLYMPTEEGDRHPMEAYLVTIDCGAIDPETARATAEAVRSGLAHTKRSPSGFRRRRIVPLDEGNFHRVQLTYSVQRPAL